MIDTKNIRTTLILVITMIMMYLFNMISHETFYSLFVLKSINFAGILPWQFITYAFYFPDMMLFFLFKIIIFFWFSSALEKTWGTKNLTIFLFICILSRSVSSFVFGILPVYGISTLYISLMVAFGFNFPDQRIHLFFFLPVKVKLLAIISIVIIFVQAITALLLNYISIDFSSNHIALIKLPINIAAFLVTIVSYIAIIVFYKRIFGEGHIKKFISKAKRNIKIVEDNVVSQKNINNNNDFASIIHKVKNKERLHNEDKNKLNSLDNGNNDLCSLDDFNEKDDYCISCDKYGKCVKRSISSIK